MNKTDNITLPRGDCKNDNLRKKVCQSMKLIESLYTGSEILAFSGGKTDFRQIVREQIGL